jgi:transposase
MHVPRELDVHAVLDNLSAHKSEPVRTWLADPKPARWHLCFTPTSASWLNLIEGWFSVLTRKALRDASFTSVRQLEDAIDVWHHTGTTTRNRSCEPRPSTTSSPRSNEEEPPSTASLTPRRTTRETATMIEPLASTADHPIPAPTRRAAKA